MIKLVLMGSMKYIKEYSTLTGVTGMLLIAGFSLPVSGIILGGTALGCYHLTKKEKNLQNSIDK